MRDLKDLLEPLGDRPMPDRWDAIQHRPVHPMPEPHRSRLGAGIAAAAVAILAIAVIVWLSPLGGPHEESAASPGGPPPTWLVDQAYQLAYQNGDLTPDRAEWVLTDANTIAPAVGLQSGDPNVQEYLLVLHGHFTAWDAPTPPGADVPSGSILVQAFSADTQSALDFGVTNDAVDVPGLTAFDLPDASQSYISPQGWTIPVPPGWRARAATVPEPRGPGQGTLITNGAATASTASGDEPAVAASNFPSTGVATVVSDLPPDGQTQPVVPPVRWSSLSQVANDQGSTAWRISVEGPRQIFTVEVRVGDTASPQDVAALHDMIVALAFGDEAATLPSPSGAPGPPTQASVVDGRFVSDVELDNGAFSVQPAPIDTVPVISQADAEQLLLASRLFETATDGVVGFGLVTSQVSQNGVPTYQSDPAWVAFGWGGSGVSGCKAPAPSPTVSNADLPSGGYVAVALIEGAGGGDISYQARSAECGTAVGPFVAPATHVESVPWTQDGPIVNNEAYVLYSPAPCGSEDSFQGSPDSKGRLTVSIAMTVPDVVTSCPSVAPIRTRVASSIGPEVTSLEHGPTGIVRQAPF
jgi:hypothetical protein